MRRTLAISAILIFGFSGIALAAQGEENAETAMQIHQIEVDWHTALTTKNLALMMSLFADDATYTAPTGKTFSGKAQIRQAFQANSAFEPQNQFVAYTPPSRFKYDREGDTGHVYFECLTVNQATDMIVPRTHVGVNADLIRDNGRWLIKDAKGALLPRL